MVAKESRKLRTFYNSSCPVCTAGIRAYSRSPEVPGAFLDWQDINAAPKVLEGQGISQHEVWYRLHTIDEAGRVLVGIDAFIAIWDELPAYRRRACLLRLPVVRQLAYLGYEALAFCLYRWNLWRARRGAG